nr:hypothetical protein [Tanacetum cinerariifolium]
MDLFSLIRAPNPTKVPPPEEVPVTTVPGGDQAAPVAVEPLPVQESRKRGREGIDANAPPKDGSIQLNSAPNPTKVKTRSRPRAPHELPLLTLTASRV